MVSIVVVTYNSERTIDTFLNSVIEHSSSLPEIIIVDGSNKTYGQEGVIINPKGSYPSGLNLGIQAAHGKYIVCCNPDIEVQDGWLEKLKEPIKYGLGISTPMSNFASGIQGYTPLIGYNQIKNIEVGFFIGFCFMLSKPTYYTLGEFDEQFEFEQDDIDYSLRCQYAGVPVLVVPSCFVKHAGHQSMDSTSLDKRWLSMYRLYKKYPTLDFQETIGVVHPSSWLTTVLEKYPDLAEVESYKKAVKCYK